MSILWRTYVSGLGKNLTTDQGSCPGPSKKNHASAGGTAEKFRAIHK